MSESFVLLLIVDSMDYFKTLGKQHIIKLHNISVMKDPCHILQKNCNLFFNVKNYRKSLFS